MRQPRPDKPPPDAHRTPDCVCGIGGIGFTTLPRPSCLARRSSCGGAALPRRYVSRWGEGGAGPVPVCVRPLKKVGASTYLSSGPTMKRCLISNESLALAEPVARKPWGNDRCAAGASVPVPSGRA
jgi:hypothetical protein